MRNVGEPKAQWSEEERENIDGWLEEEQRENKERDGKRYKKGEERQKEMRMLGKDFKKEQVDLKKVEKQLDV